MHTSRLLGQPFLAVAGVPVSVAFPVSYALTSTKQARDGERVRSGRCRGSHIFLHVCVSL